MSDMDMIMLTAKYNAAIGRERVKDKLLSEANAKNKVLREAINSALKGIENLCVRGALVMILTQALKDTDNGKGKD